MSDWNRPHVGPAELAALGYAGQYADPESGYQYARARYYDPTTAQFLTRDLITPQTRQAYAYVNGNPLNGTDPSGLCGFLGDGPCTPSGIADDLGDRAKDVGEFVDHHRHAIVDFGTGLVAGAGFVACVASAVCAAAGAVAIGIGAVAAGGAAHLAVDALSDDDAHDLNVAQAFGHSFISTSTAALCVYTLEAACARLLVGRNLASVGAAAYIGTGFLEKWLIDRLWADLC